MVARRRFTPEFKARVILEVISGVKTTAEAGREYQLKPPVLSKWKSEFLENVARVFEGDEQRSEEWARIAELERMVGRLTMELEIAKKTSSTLVSQPSGNGRWC